MSTKKSWCVLSTSENIEVLRKWRDNKGYPKELGTYCGITKSGHKKVLRDSSEFDFIVTTREAYELMGLDKNGNALKAETCSPKPSPSYNSNYAQKSVPEKNDDEFTMKLPKSRKFNMKK